MFYRCAHEPACPGGTGGVDHLRLFMGADFDPASVNVTAAAAAQVCAPEYTDFLCSRCAPGFFFASNQCRTCPGDLEVVLRLALVVVPVLLGLLFLYQSTMAFNFSSTALLFEFFQTMSLFLTFNLA